MHNHLKFPIVLLATTLFCSFAAVQKAYSEDGDVELIIHSKEKSRSITTNSARCFQFEKIPVFIPSGKFKFSVVTDHFKGATISVDKDIGDFSSIAFIGFKISGSKKSAEFKDNLVSQRRPSSIHETDLKSRAGELLCERNTIDSSLTRCYQFSQNGWVTYSLVGKKPDIANAEAELARKIAACSTSSANLNSNLFKFISD